MDAQLDNAFANGIAVAEIARFDLPQPNAYARRSDLVAKGGKPVAEGLPAVFALIPKQFNHYNFVS